MRFPKLIAFATGLVSAFAFAPADLWFLMPIAFVVVLGLLADARTPWRAAGIGWWFGLGQFVLGLNWIATAFTYQANMPAWLGWVAVVLLSLYLALYPLASTLAAWALARIARAPARGGATFATFGSAEAVLALSLGATWIAGEWLRATLFTGFAWNPVGVVWVKVLPVASLARWIGTYGLSGLTVLVGAMLLALSARRWWGLAALAVLAAVSSLSWLGARVPPADPRLSPPLLRVVQPNIGQQDKWNEAAERTNRIRLIRLSGDPGARPRLLLWPEAAVTDFIEQSADTRAGLAALLGPEDVMLTGGVAMAFDAQGNVTAARNSLFAIDPQGRVLGRYDKAHLVPYGEYLPMRPLLSAIGLSRLAPGDLDFQSGPGPRTLALPALGTGHPLTVGVQICYEMIFSGHVVDEAQRPAFVFNPSNDAWFGRWGPVQHLAQARLRAIEEALPVVRSTPTGISAVIDADGRLEASLPWRTAGFIERPLPPAGAPTLFSRFGNALPLALALLLAIAAIATGRVRR